MSQSIVSDDTVYIHDLEAQLNARTEDYSSFPDIPKDKRSNTFSYPAKYLLLKTKLGELHDKVELEATLRSLEDAILSNIASYDLYDRIILLNKHGKGHVDKVIMRVSDLAKCIIVTDKNGIIANEDSLLTPFEIFILLCAIQIHDVGNMYGREEHTLSFKGDFERTAKESFISDPVLVSFIFSMARVHGGKINDNADTIEAAGLRTKSIVLEKEIRQRMLAAMLRFADELADDSTRALEVTRMPEYSKIFHAYSKALHTVKIEQEERETTYFVKLCYYLEIREALSNYKKLEKDDTGNLNSKDVTLIQELIKRTQKMERERRYCSRYFLPYFLIKYISVEIVIDLGGFDGEERIVYTLEETGYPVEEITLPQEVEDTISKLESKYGKSGGISHEQG